MLCNAGSNFLLFWKKGGEMNLILSRNHLEFSLFWNHFKVGRPTWLPLTSWRVIERNIWNYVVSMYLISDITVSTPALTLRGLGLVVDRAGASFELNNFPGNEMIFPIYLWERRGNRRQLPLYPHYHYRTADWKSVSSRKWLELFFYKPTAIALSGCFEF